MRKRKRCRTGSIDARIRFVYQSLYEVAEFLINAETEEEFLQEMGETKEHVLIRLKEKFKLSDTDANQYLEKYWKE